MAVMSALMAAASLPCAGQATTKPYAQILVNETMLHNPDVSTLSMLVPMPASRDYVVVASNSASAIGSKADKDDLDVLAGNPHVTTPDITNHRCQAVMPLHDVAGATIGILRVSLKAETGAADQCAQKAEALRDELANVVPSARVLFDPFIVASSPRDCLAQRLTIETLAKYPDVLVLAFHVTAPGESTNRVIGINQSKFLGRPSDDVDQDIAKTGTMIIQVIPSTHRMEIHMPLRAADGSLVGTLVTVYLWRVETQAPALISRSMKIRDELRPRIPNLVSLLNQEQSN